jgi:hypothetical protein
MKMGIYEKLKKKKKELKEPNVSEKTNGALANENEKVVKCGGAHLCNSMSKKLQKKSYVIHKENPKIVL